MKRKIITLTIYKSEIIDFSPIEKKELILKSLENNKIDLSIFETKDFKNIKFSNSFSLCRLTFSLKKYKDLKKKIKKISSEKGFNFPVSETSITYHSYFMGTTGSGKSFSLLKSCLDIGFNTIDIFKNKVVPNIFLDESFHLDSYNHLINSLKINKESIQKISAKNLNEHQKNILIKKRESYQKRNSFLKQYKQINFK